MWVSPEMDGLRWGEDSGLRSEGKYHLGIRCRSAAVFIFRTDRFLKGLTSGDYYFSLNLLKYSVMEG